MAGCVASVAAAAGWSLCLLKVWLMTAVNHVLTHTLDSTISLTAITSHTFNNVCQSFTAAPCLYVQARFKHEPHNKPLSLEARHINLRTLL